MSSSEQKLRLGSGGLIDRSKPVSFTFDGRSYRGYAGDTLASALLANDVRLVGRSFKYHRPRGILSAGSEEPNALVELREGARREPNTRATMIELFDGLVANSQNRWPSLKLDLLSVNGLMSPVFVAGFYYKTFMWPAALWEKLYEPMIRRAAGLGRAADFADPDQYEKETAHCDVLVVGAGPSGLFAALAAARAGKRVVIADETACLGGRLIADNLEVDGQSGAAWSAAAVDELSSFENVKLLPRTTVFGVYDGNTYGAVERVADHLPLPKANQPRQRLWRIVASHTIVAAGGTERPIAFGNNDRPGVMMAGAVRTYINRFAVAPARRAAVFTSNDDGASTATALHSAGVEIAALVDTREHSSEYVRHLESLKKFPVIHGVVTDAIGRLEVKEARIEPRHGTPYNVDCDLIAVSGGWNPNCQMATHLGGKTVWNTDIAAFTPDHVPAGMSVIGTANGDYSLNDCFAGAAEAIGKVLTALGSSGPSLRLPKTLDESTEITAFWHVEKSNHKALVDFQNDVTSSDIALAEREGFRSVEHLKRYTTLGMAIDQGRTSSVNGLAIMAAITGNSIPNTGTTKARPPYSPVAIGAFAGHHRGKSFRPERRPPSYDWTAENGGKFVNVGLWRRPSCYPRRSDANIDQTIAREAETVRNAVGVCDVSTLGKIDVQGPDAAELLNRAYINGMKLLKVGRARYGAMLREDGILMDDGTVARFAENHFFVTTTTANAGKVYQHLHYCAQWLWPDLDVQLSSATDQWAQYAVAGPKSRNLLREVVDHAFDISNEAFPYMQVAKITVCGGTKARLFRLSFSGERAYEIAVPARFGDALFRKLMSVGEKYGVCAYGTEALGVLRIEKGHISGPELDGTTTAADAGLGGMMSKKKDFIGRTLSQRPGLVVSDRPSLVGFKPVDRNQRLRSGAHFIPLNMQPVARNDQGHMTSVAYSPNLGHWIGLGYLKRGPERVGEVLRAVDLLRDEDIEVEVVSPVFIDPEGERLRG